MDPGSVIVEVGPLSVETGTKTGNNHLSSSSMCQRQMPSDIARHVEQDAAV